MKREIEILYELNESISDALAKLGDLTYQGVVRVTDTYYVDPLRDTLKPSKTGKLLGCCRLRQKEGKTLIAFKTDHFKGDEWLYSDEFETEVMDLTTMQSIFSNLGLEVLIEVDSSKTVLTDETFEIVLEEVKDLGTFIEVEYRFSDDLEDVPGAKQHIRDWLNARGVQIGDEMNAGKPELLLQTHDKFK